ncbi:hypothetical protein H9Q74_004545 [Fusarium xylarioides]|nr:hypothetical protein H9Q71_004748 [Fusarium xylarioides]KAG5825369.1 hypothetical protein H9Q74_004545 [Fusarium xylarioides]
MAMKMEYLEIVKMILGHKFAWGDVYLELPDTFKNTPLHVASMQGSRGIASELISAGADVDAEAEKWRTPLHLASLAGNELMVKLLLERKANVNVTDEEGFTPLHLASGFGQWRRKRTPELDLIKPDVNSLDDSESDIWCWDPPPTGHAPVIELLLRNGADPTIKDAYGYTALHDAAIVGDKENIAKLLELMQPDALSWGDWKQSPIHSALLGEQPLAAMKSLLAKEEIKEALFWKNGGKLQVIEMAATMVQSFDVLGLIFRELPSDRGIAVTGTDNWGPIEWAAHERLPCVLSKLIDDSGHAEDIDRMVHEALQTTSKSITPNELENEPSCERLVQVMWILITNSQRTRKNIEAVSGAWSVVRNGPSACQTEATPYNIAEPFTVLRRKASDLSDHKKRQNTLSCHDRELSPLRDNSKLQATLQSRDREPWENTERRHRCFGRESRVEISKEVQQSTILGTLQDILKDPPFAQISQTHKDEVDYKPPVPGPSTKRIVQTAEATVVAFFKAKGESGSIRGNRPIKEVTYDPGPTEVVGTAIRNLLDMTKRGSMRFNSNLYAKQNLKLTWVHLPSTNDILTTIMSHERYSTRDYYKVRSFFRDSWVEVPDKESRSRMMRPRSVIRPKGKSTDVQSKEEETTELTTLTETDRDEDGSRVTEVTEGETKLDDSRTENQRIYDDWDCKSGQLPKKPHGFVPASAIYMPYLSYSTHCRHWDSRLVSDDSDLKQRHDHYEDLLDTYKGQDKQQHGSPTLDEWYYQFAQEDTEAINDQNSRNKSQVVSKYLRENERGEDICADREPNKWTVVRVNQVWIWTISTDWVITATSSPLGGSPDMLVEEILNSLRKQGEYGGSGPQPVSAAELVPAIIDHCIGSYERRPNDGERLSIGQTFSHYINRIGRKETTLFDDFRAWSPSEHRQKRKPKDQGKDCSPAETMIGRSADPSPSTTIETTQRAGQAPSHGNDISAAIKKAKDLYCDIKDIRDELNILKSVAQYQQIVQRGLASKEVDESRFSSTYVVKDLRELDSIAERIQLAINTTLSLQQSEVANRQATEATEATRQGKTVMTFTFATVLFLPLSFLSSLFALDVASFQEAPAWAFYIIFLVSIGISTILGLGVFYWDSVERAKENILHIARDACEDALKPTPDSPIVSDDITDNKKWKSEPGIVLETGDQDRGIINRFRGYGQRTKVDEVEKY